MENDYRSFQRQTREYYLRLIFPEFKQLVSVSLFALSNMYFQSQDKYQEYKSL